MGAEALYSIYLFVIGLCAGSFANACIHRWLKEESLIPRSHCPVCGHLIAWYDNIPVLSFLFLGGKCRHCHAAISLMYPAVELLNGFLFVAAYHIYGISWATAKILFLGWMFIVAFVSDLLQREIPDEIFAMGTIAGVIMVFIGQTNWLEALLGFCLPAIPLLIFTLIMEYATGKEEMLGGGDLKFLMGIGTLGGSMLSTMTLAFGAICLSIMFAGVLIEDLITGSRTEVPMAVGFFIAFLMLFLFGVLPTIII